MPEVSIIIVNWNAREYLLRCLRAIAAHAGGVDYDVWIVDNASTDDSVAAVRREFPQANLIVNPENVGFSRANNQAIRQSTGEYLLLLNSDAFLHPGTLPRLLQEARGHPDTAITGCKLIYEDGTFQPSCYGFPTLATELWQTLWLDRLFPHSRIFGKYRMTYWQMDDAREVDWLMGACMMAPRTALEQVELFDEQIFMYSEETDLCFRLKKAGWKVRFVPDVQVTHIWGGSSSQVREETLLRLYQSRVQFFRKHYGALTALLYKGMLRINSLVRSMAGMAAFFFSRSDARRTKALSYWRLFRSVRAF